MLSAACDVVQRTTDVAGFCVCPKISDLPSDASPTPDYLDILLIATSHEKDPAFEAHAAPSLQRVGNFCALHSHILSVHYLQSTDSVVSLESDGPSRELAPHFQGHCRESTPPMALLTRHPHQHQGHLMQLMTHT